MVPVPQYNPDSRNDSENKEKNKGFDKFYARLKCKVIVKTTYFMFDDHDFLRSKIFKWKHHSPVEISFSVKRSTNSLNSAKVFDLETH